jgi:hypothetical protein
MKSLYVLMALFISLQLACCADASPSRYVAVLPELPLAWTELLGEPEWRLEWFNPDGYRQISEISGKSTEIDLPVTWTNPVIAFPYWQQHYLPAGLFRPAGALFPFDVSSPGKRVFGKKENRIYLTWEAGVDVFFYRELALANNENSARLPTNFDWLRFRQLFQSETINTDVRKDPWLINWQFVAERTVSSNFDQRRLVPQAVELMPIPVSPGDWYAASPFAEPLVFLQGETPVFPVHPGLNVWVSASGILRVNGKNWVFTESP